jgi:hypothetical protein
MIAIIDYPGIYAYQLMACEGMFNAIEPEREVSAENMPAFVKLDLQLQVKTVAELWQFATEDADNPIPQGFEEIEKGLRYFLFITDGPV